MDIGTALKWLNDETGSNFKTLSESRSGKEIADLLIRSTNLNEHISEIKIGQTQLDRTFNFQTIRKIMREVGVSFPYDIRKITEGDENEILQLLNAIRKIVDQQSGIQEEVLEYDIEEEDKDEFENVESLFDDVEKELQNRILQQNTMKQEIELHAQERDFYLSKLMQIEKLTKKYPIEEVGTVVAVLENPNTDLAPIQK
ncbi:hypothetical protein TVAG_242820 [Trichomonas vaginalis G3]|uniref:Uncharacterized protein n=1 Tax=Trichomonas vaginalis (strain ATCC PRA-98 / G3) TaxID=412133 RepID=A2F841_TRIV3|nr:EB1 dimerization domain-like family [Trichomonas vaginalis G3]EAX98917.1 hypothetical protein TVAG_242820 [Trichomonas vaginalis G3]KAI5526706.1 EB1 dimerization domain-like family [Trichomonas vaginalis G3]|eukprot:XP_001311847.1 hypothetical protein [Trichomonas vaginalis G3]